MTRYKSTGIFLIFWTFLDATSLFQQSHERNGNCMRTIVYNKRLVKYILSYLINITNMLFYRAHLCSTPSSFSSLIEVAHHKS